MPGIHRKVDIIHVWFIPILILLVVLRRLLKDKDALAERFPLSDLVQFGLDVPTCQSFILF